MICPNCKKQLYPDNKFCTFCGTKINPSSFKFDANPSFFEILFKRRINRRNFLLGWLSLYILLLIFYFIFGILWGLITGSSTIPDETISIVSFIGGIYYVFITISLGIRRSHDIGKSGSYILWGFIPLVNIAIGINLLFKEGDLGNNTYGTQPAAKIELLNIFGFKPGKIDSFDEV